MTKSTTNPGLVRSRTFGHMTRRQFGMGAGAVVSGAVAKLDDLPKSMYPYDDIQGWFDTAGGITKLWPTEPEGNFVTFDQVTKGWERFLAA